MYNLNNLNIYLSSYSYSLKKFDFRKIKEEILFNIENIFNIYLKIVYSK